MPSMKALWLALLTPLIGMTAYGQTLTYAEGAVFVDEARVDASTVPFLLSPNAIVRTEAGRAQVQMNAEGTISLDEHTSARAGDRISLLAGSAVVATGGSEIRMDCEDGVTLSGSGTYRFDYRPVAQARENVC